uniref:Uncharacterized protein n=1 Tax=Arundo donax TaxID=35708 RepID=A0A0A9UQ19_ARUDO
MRVKARLSTFGIISKDGSFLQEIQFIVSICFDYQLPIRNRILGCSPLVYVMLELSFCRNLSFFLLSASVLVSKSFDVGSFGVNA